MIRELAIPADTLAALGLKPPALFRDLRAVVLLAGANGSGKSRILQAVTKTILEAGAFAQSFPEVSPRTGWEIALAQLSGVENPDDFTVAQKKNYVEALKNLDKAEGVKVDTPDGLRPLRSARRVIDLTYTLGASIHNAQALNPAGLVASVRATENPGFNNAFQHQHSYLTVIAKHLFNSGHESFQTRAEMQAQRADADRFNEIVKALLGLEVGWTSDPETGDPVPMVMGRIFQEQELSKGQKILLAWSIILHRQRQHLENAIVVIDEPENHLHPDVCVDALTNLQQRVLGKEGQIWLATHSVPLIAWAGIRNIHFVCDSAAGYGGNRVDAVIDRLVGGPTGRDRLQTFLADADRVAMYQFAAEALTPPDVVSATIGDPQATTFARVISARASGGRPLRVLDYGAGRARLAAALLEATRETTAVPSRFEYVGYDRGTQCSSEAGTQISALNAAGIKASWNADLRSFRGINDRVDVVVLCNVLHEIPIAQWLKTFGQLQDVLADDGCVVLMEDQAPNVGELPNSEGFLILDEIETKRLFGDDASVRGIVGAIERPWKERLTAIEVPRAALTKASAQTISLALQDLRTRARDKIEMLRGKTGEKPSFQDGRLHAFYALLWVNAQLALESYTTAATNPTPGPA